uniref:Endo-1,6-alpha-mannosidase n=1 Tax=Psilocybe cubensis TaxID=181762 RepID=A0A8H8CE62_PSICU
MSVAQDLGVPLSWRKFNNSRPTSERISISQNAINTILPQLDSSTGQFNGIGYWQAANVFSAMALQDQVAKTTTNKNIVVNNLKLVFGLFKNYDQFGWWAQAAHYAFKSYGDTELLNNSIATWNSVSNYMITPAQAQAGKTPFKSFALAGTCDGVTMAGGVFWRPTTDDTAINSITTGLFLTLSSYLYETTRDTKYLSAATMAANWIKAHNIATSSASNPGILLDTEDGDNCSRSPASWLFTYNSGKFLEGLSVLANVTGDSQWEQLMLTTAAAAIKNAPWQGSNGIIIEGADTDSNNDGVGFKGTGLLEVFRRTPQNSALRILIHSYVDVQYNALLDLASSGNDYSANWLGPQPSGFTTWGQLAALDVLVAAVEAN